MGPRGAHTFFSPLVKGTDTKRSFLGTGEGDTGGFGVVPHNYLLKQQAWLLKHQARLFFVVVKALL